MSKKNKRLYMILGSAVGTAAAVYGIRSALRWWNNRQDGEMWQYSSQGSDFHRGGVYDTSAPAEQTPGQPTAQTMPRPPAKPAGQSPAQSPSGDQSFSGTHPAPGSQFEKGEWSQSERQGAPGNQPQESQATTQPRYQPVDQPDRQAIPTTGPAPAPPMTSQVSADAAESVSNLDDLAGPLIEYAIAFNSVMNLLRSKQRDANISSNGPAFTTSDRSSMNTVLDQLREHTPDLDELSSGKTDPLQQRTLKLVKKLRETLETLDYSESDLFRINGEVRSEMCSLTLALQGSGKVTITGLDQVQQLYDC